MNKENPMGVLPIPKIIKTTSLPMIFSLLMNSLYNVVDSIFISHISEDALTALSLASPIQLIIGALGCGIAVGLNAAVSKALGEKNQHKVKKITSAALILAGCAYLITATIGLLCTNVFFTWQSNGNYEIYQHGTSYLRICMLFSFGTLLQWVFDRLLIATGKSKLFLISLTSASVVNLVLDPILIFGYLGLPALGTAGAAIATIIGQICGAIVGYIVNVRMNKEIPIVLDLKVKFKYLWEILKVGIPTAIMQAVVALTGVVMNTMLQSFSLTAVAIMGICNRIQGLALIVPNGINLGVIPIIAYNYGAKNRQRVKDTIKYMLLYGAFLMIFVTLVLEVFPKQILLMFDASSSMLNIGIPAIRILAIAYFIALFSMGYSTVFQSLGKGNYSMYLTIIRQVILPVILVYLLSKFNQINLVWIAFIIAEAMSIPIALLFYQNIKRGIIDHI